MNKLFALGLLLACASVQAAPADDVVCSKCVDASDLSANAIAGRHLKTGVVLYGQNCQQIGQSDQTGP